MKRRKEERKELEALGLIVSPVLSPARIRRECSPILSYCFSYLVVSDLQLCELFTAFEFILLVTCLVVDD